MERDSHEISKLSFHDFERHGTQLLLSSSWDSSLKIYDEENPDASNILRHTVGGHDKEDICIMDVS
jgi:hypothetical protein